ncbi:MAG: TolC family protein [Leptospiraceae bacterium]|nr:TolC family protein [Leptospiraceae bacterium]MCP5511933.1 TolC family protein [Leptospiraceae bacterium]
MIRILLFISILFSLVLSPLLSQETNEEVKTPKVKLTLKEAVQRAIENSPDIKNTAFELIKSDSGYLKSQSKYSWRFVGGLDSQKSTFPNNRSNFFTGTKSSTDKFNAGIEKIFMTGTYFKIDASSQRFDSNAFEDPVQNASSGFSALALRPLYTGAITLTLSQDILKNSFGLKDQNIDKMLKHQSEINKLDLSYKLSGTIVDTMVSYWSYIVSESSVQTFEQLLKNSKNIRNLTIQKTRLGLAENFEINQWNALISQTENQLEKAKLEKEESRRKLSRILNLPPDHDLGEITDLEKDLPETIDFDKDLAYAFEHRHDWKSLGLKKEIAQLTKENAKDDALPSVKVTASRSAKGQTLISPQANYTNTQYGIPSTKYYDAIANVKVTYPLFDKGVKAGLRDAEIMNYQVSLEEDNLKREIYDDVYNKYQQVVVGHKILENSIETRKQSEAYYKGLYNSFRQGRYTAVMVKNALDNLVQNQLSETQSMINFNINLMRYELAKNELFEKYDISIEKILPKF